VISVILDRMHKFGTGTDWTQVQIDTDRKVRAVVPGSWLDDAACTFVNRQIRNVAQALQDTSEAERVLKLLAAGDWAGAGAELVRHALPDLAAAKVS
jgi:hypothetical protein